MASDTDETNRRDFLLISASAFAAVGGAAAAWPFIDQMNPDASTLSVSTIEVDLSKIDVGQAVTVKWRGSPVFIRRRTSDEIAEARKTKLADLPDQLSRNGGLAQDAADTAADVNRTVPGKQEWLVLIGSCTHLGCVPSGQKLGSKKGDFNGWYCPCHGSHYDTSGRIRKGPAPENLPVPPYKFLTDTTIKIG